MLKLNTIRKNFYESRSTYEDNAFIQRNMAEKLASMLGNSYKIILEIGCGTGTLTKHIYAKCSFEQYHALDIVPEYGELLQNKFPKLLYTVFDMDMLQDYEPTRNFDLILSNAAIQWSKNPAALIRTCMRRLNPDGTLALAFFGEKNFQEIREVFNVGLTYLNGSEINAVIHPCRLMHFSEETEEMRFPDTISVLRHIKNTGVGGMTHVLIKKEQLKQYDTQGLNGLVHQEVVPALAALQAGGLPLDGDGGVEVIAAGVGVVDAGVVVLEVGGGVFGTVDIQRGEVALEQAAFPDHQDQGGGQYQHADHGVEYDGAAVVLLLLAALVAALCFFLRRCAHS